MSNGRLPDTGVQGGSSAGELGRLLKEARAERGLELSDVSELTHVRQDYLRALEEGRFGDLPEDVYTRNFVRLYAQAVGVPGAQALEVYQAERQRAGGLSTIEERLEKERRGEPPPQRRRQDLPRGPRVGPAVLTLLLVVGLVGLAVWGYNSLFFRGATPVVTDGGTPDQLLPAPTASAPSPVTEAAGQVGAPEQPASSGTVLIDVNSSPPGATVTIDGFRLPGVTPIQSAPVTARSGRIMRVTLDGYEAWEQPVDLSSGRSIQVDLTQATAVQTAPQAEAGVAQGQLALSITAPSWLEVYQGGARNQGERLVYTTAQPGASYTFDLPVYVYTGNAAGVEVTVGQAPPFVLGSSGAIVGRAFQ